MIIAPQKILDTLPPCAPPPFSRVYTQWFSAVFVDNVLVTILALPPNLDTLPSRCVYCIGIGYWLNTHIYIQYLVPNIEHGVLRVGALDLSRAVRHGHHTALWWEAAVIRDVATRINRQQLRTRCNPSNDMNGVVVNPGARVSSFLTHSLSPRSATARESVRIDETANCEL